MDSRYTIRILCPNQTTNTNKLFMGFVLYNRLRIAGTRSNTVKSI
jgi:hypothetical protein